MRLLWAAQYRLYLWLSEHTRRPRDVADYLAAFPRARHALKVLTPKMQEAFGLAPVRPELYYSPECGNVELHLIAFIPADMKYDEAAHRLDGVLEWMFEQTEGVPYDRCLNRHVDVRFKWTENSQ